MTTRPTSSPVASASCRCAATRPHSSFVIRHSSFRRAFSIIEIVAVISILGILVAMTMPAVRYIGKDNDRVQSLNLVRAALAEARSIAMAQHRQAGVVFFEESAQYANPVHPGQVALQIFVEDYNQSRVIHHPNNTIFIAYSPARSYLPKTVGVAALNDDLKRGVMTGDESSGGVGKTRAILFNADGHMITRHGLSRDNLTSSGTPGTYPHAQGDWSFTSQGTPTSDSSSKGISSPGIFLYDLDDYTGKNIPTDNSAASNAARNDWIKRHATVVLINANTGGIVE